MQAFLIIMAIVVSILFLLVDLYLMAIYSHKQEPNASCVNIYCKILIVLTLLQTQFQPFFLIIDVVNGRNSNEDLTAFWLILYISLIINLAVLKPIATSLYERDEDDPCCKNVIWIIVQIFISVVVVTIFIVIAWFFWGKVQINVDLIQVDSQNFSIAQSSQNYVERQSYFQFQITIVCFFIAFFCIIGYPILACCGAIGLTVVPISLILEFVNRPTFRRTVDAKKVSEFLKVETVRLLRQHQQLTRQQNRVDQASGFFNRRKVKGKFEDELKEIESQVELQKDYYQLFKMQLQMQKVNPVVFWLKLVLGLLSIIFSIMIWVQILLSQLIYPYEDGHSSKFLDQLFMFLEKQNANFVSVAFVMLVCIYFTFCIIKGSIFFSHSLPFITVHPIQEGKTWLNSFLFHLSMCSISAASLIHMLSQTFPYYLRGGNIAVILDALVSNMQVIGWILSKKIFTYCFLAIGGLGVFYVTCKLICFNPSKGELLGRIEAKRLKLFGKDGQNQSLNYIEMVEMKKKDEEKHLTKKKK